MVDANSTGARLKGVAAAQPTAATLYGGRGRALPTVASIRCAWRASARAGWSPSAWTTSDRTAATPCRSGINPTGSRYVGAATRGRQRARAEALLTDSRGCDSGTACDASGIVRPPDYETRVAIDRLGRCVGTRSTSRRLRAEA